MERPSRRERKAVAGKRRHGGMPIFRRHRRLITVLITIVFVFGAAGASYAFVLNSKFANIAKFGVNDKLSEKNRPDPDKGKDLNILLLGSDKSETPKNGSAKTTLSQDAKAAKWPQGKYRSDTVMIVHLSANRKHVYLVSVPRDSLLELYDAKGNATHKEKVNAAFSLYGPTGAISTVEHLSNLRMKHIAIIDWDGFKDLSTAVGGVPVCIPRDVYDDAQHKNWTAGEHLLKGEEALQYVRQRHGLPNGDFDRIDRQQNFLRSLMDKILDSGTMHNPVKLNNTLEALTRNLTVDSGWTSGDMRGLALSLRSTKAKNVTFMTLPIAGTSTNPQYGDVVNVDQAKSKALFAALKDDTVGEYLKENPDVALKGDKKDNKKDKTSGPAKPSAKPSSPSSTTPPAKCKTNVS